MHKLLLIFKNLKVLKIFCFISLIILSNFNTISAETNMVTKIKHFAKVDTFLYRGAQPTHEDLITLKEKGIKRIINFRNEKNLITKEKKEVEALGLEYISIPWLIYKPYNKDIFNRFFETIKDQQPTFFHCKRGSERTGVIASAYKIKFNNFTYKQAINYAKKFDLKLIWLGSVKSKIKKFYIENANNAT